MKLGEAHTFPIESSQNTTNFKTSSEKKASDVEKKYCTVRHTSIHPRKFSIRTYNKFKKTKPLVAHHLYILSS